MRILTLNKREHTNIDVLARHFSLIPEIEVINWNPQIKSAFDAFDEYKPDILLFHHSLSGLIMKVRKSFPNTKFVCENNTNEENVDYDLNFTTVCNTSFPIKPFLYIGYDLASLINKSNKLIYSTDVCFNGNMNNQKNIDQFQELVNPISDIRINGRLKFYGIGHTGEYACGVLSDIDQFSAYSQAKVSIILKNWFNNELYESPITLANSLKVNHNTIHNIPEYKNDGYFVENKKQLLEEIQQLTSNQEYIEKPKSEFVTTAFSGCLAIFQHLQLDDSKINETATQLIKRYSL